MDRIAKLIFAAGAWGAIVSAQEKDLTSLSLEQILNMEVVSVSKVRAKLSRTPAAVHVITQDDIRRSGASSLPDALRLAPGIHVARLRGGSWAIGMRGFNNTISNKLLVMIDGRSIYNPVMSGVLWKSQMVMLEDIERIEVIRGPAGAVWGANAVNGVINVVTKAAAQTQGTLVAVAGGAGDLARASVRHGGALGESGAWRTWMHHETTATGRAMTPQPEIGPWHADRGGVRMDWKKGDRDTFEIQGEVSTVREGVNWYGYPRPLTLTVEKANTVSSGGFVLGKWTHESARGDQSRLQVFEDSQQNDLGLVDLRAHTFDADFQHSIGLGARHGLMVGGGFRSSAVSSEATQQLSFSPAGRRYSVLNAFIEHEWALAPDKLALTLGGKVERYTLSGVAFQPSARLLWTPDRKRAFWGAVSRAVRTPSHADFAARYPIGGTGAAGLLPFTITFTGNEQIRPEGLWGGEAGARLQLSRRILLEISLYRNSYRKLNDTYQMPFPLDPTEIGRYLVAAARAFPGRTPTVPALQVNGRDTLARGGEAVFHYEVSKAWRLTGSYSGAFLRTRIRPGIDPRTILDSTNYYPRHMFQIRSSWDLGRRWFLDIEAYRSSSLVDSVHRTLPAWTRADARLEWRWTDGLALNLQGRNLLRAWQIEYPGDALSPSRSTGRAITAGLRWER